MSKESLESNGVKSSPKTSPIKSTQKVLINIGMELDREFNEQKEIYEAEIIRLKETLHKAQEDNIKLTENNVTLQEKNSQLQSENSQIKEENDTWKALLKKYSDLSEQQYELGLETVRILLSKPGNK